MSQPKWMQGAPVENNAQPRWMQGQAQQEEPPKLPTKVEQNNQMFIDNLPSQKSLLGRMGAFGGQYSNSMTFGQADNINAAIDSIPQALGGQNFTGESFSDKRATHRDGRQMMREANPVSAMAGEISGYLAPGAAVWKSLSAAGKSIPGAATLANGIAQSGRVPTWLSRMAGSAGLFTADSAVFGATVGASNEAAVRGEDLSLSESAGVGIDYAKANLGEMADGMGIDIPQWARAIPASVALPVAGSITERSLKGLQSGGKTITPDRVQAEVMQETGRLPSPNSTAGAMAEVIPGERVTGGTIKTFRFVENALRNGLKDAGLAPAEITGRVTRGFDSIRESLPALADGSTTLAQLIEREFADAGPQVSENIRLFLLRVGLDDPAVTQGVIQKMRSGQVEDFRTAVNENLGSQRQYDLEQSLKQGLSKIGETYDQILNKAKSQGNNSPLADSMREQLRDSRFKFELTEEASKRGWKDVDTFIQQDPWSAAHKMKSKLLTEARAAKSSGNYEKYQEPAVYLREMLNELPGYSALSKMYAKESSVLDTLGHVDTLPNGQKKTVEGFGPKLRKAGRSETETLRMADEYGAMPERQQQAAGISTGQVLKDQLRTARPGGTDLQGQDVMGLRLSDLQNEGMMSTNPQMPGALPMVFGSAGENISKRVDDIVNSRKFLADIDPNTGSNTVNKANAQMSGDSVVTSGLPRTMTSGYTQSGLMDATMFASGLPPIATMMTKGLPALGRVLGPGRGTRAEIAKALMQRPARTGAPPPSPEALPQLTGRNRPRKWRKDPKWSDPNLTNPQIEGSIEQQLMDAIKVRAKPSERGSIDTGGGPRRRKDVMRDLRNGGPRQFPAERSQLPQLGSPRATEPRRSTGIIDSPLIPMAAMGVGGSGVVAGLRHLNHPEAATGLPQIGQSEAPHDRSGPSVKPDLDHLLKASTKQANNQAWSQDKAQRQEFWSYLKSKRDGSSVEWNQIQEERAADLVVSPQDAARGVIQKRLPYIYDQPVSVLRDAPVEELIGGQWHPVSDRSPPK